MKKEAAAARGGTRSAASTQRFIPQSGENPHMEAVLWASRATAGAVQARLASTHAARSHSA